MKGGKRINAVIPEHLHNEFKAVCAQRGKDMQGVLEDLIRDHIAEKNKPVPARDSV